MTKAEELIIVAKIEDLIAEAGADSYIRMTFAGICDICRRNIEDDFGDQPVRDLDLLRLDYDAERQMHDQTKHLLAESQKMCKEALDENERLRKLVAEWEQNAHDAGEMYCGLEEEIKTQNAEITRLRAEIVRMKLERMTDVEYAELYEKMEGAK